MDKVIAILRQPSSYAGFGLMLAMFGVNIMPEQIAQLGGGIMAALAIALPEGK